MKPVPRWLRILRSVLWWFVGASIVLDYGILVTMKALATAEAAEQIKTTLFCMVIKAAWMAWSYWRWGKDAKQS